MLGRERSDPEALPDVLVPPYPFPAGRGRRRPIANLVVANTQYDCCSLVEFNVRSRGRCARARSIRSLTVRMATVRLADVIASCSRAVAPPSERENSPTTRGVRLRGFIASLAGRLSSETARESRAHHDAKHSNNLVSRIFNFVVYAEIQPCL